MDLLFTRYANPFLLLDEMIASSRMPEFVDAVIKAHHEERDDDALWQFYLHKVFDKTYADFLRESRKTRTAPKEESIDFEATIKESMSMLQNFEPS